MYLTLVLCANSTSLTFSCSLAVIVDDFLKVAIAELDVDWKRVSPAVLIPDARYGSGVLFFYFFIFFRGLPTPYSSLKSSDVL